MAADKEAKIPFKELCIEYDTLVKSNNFGNNVERIKLIEQERSLIKDAYYTLGFKKMAELKFNQTNIHRHLIKQLDIPQKEQIKKLLLERIGILKPIEVSKAKEIIAEIYTFLEVKKTAKATDLHEYFHCKEHNKKHNCLSVRHIEIIKEKMIG